SQILAGIQKLGPGNVAECGIEYPPRTMRWTWTLLPALLAVSCGGAKAKTETTGENEGFETAETRCIAAARGQHESKKDEPEKLDVKQILVKFAGAKNAKADIKRSRGDACMRALEARNLLQAGDSFASVVASYSDEPGAATREGSVGTIKRSD